jgi:hypothetical protein
MIIVGKIVLIIYGVVIVIVLMQVKLNLRKIVIPLDLGAFSMVQINV